MVRSVQLGQLYELDCAVSQRRVPSARGRWRTRLVGRLRGPLGTHTVRPGKHFHCDCYSPIVHDVFSRCFIRQCCRGNPPAKDSRPTAVGIERMETGDFLMNLALQSWQLDAGSLWGLLNLSTDKGIMVTVHLASSRDGNADSDLLDLSVH